MADWLDEALRCPQCGRIAAGCEEPGDNLRQRVRTAVERHTYKQDEMKYALLEAYATGWNHAQGGEHEPETYATEYLAEHDKQTGRTP